jgi:hypothetical protein
MIEKCLYVDRFGSGCVAARVTMSFIALTQDGVIGKEELKFPITGLRSEVGENGFGRRPILQVLYAVLGVRICYGL